MPPSDFVLNATLSVITLLFIATFVSFLLRNSKIPYTVMLVLVGVGVGYLADHLAVLSFMSEFKLSPELVFYVFLPTLIFESAFHMNVKQFRQNIFTTMTLSTLGMLISVFLIAWGMHAFLQFPWGTALLFGALISATDPISVLSLFKKIGAPKRLATIVEGESLFNDGMALVLFGIFLEGQSGFVNTFMSFVTVVVGGVLTGVVMGFVFSKALDYVRNSKEIEISITLILAHSTFIIAEYFLGVSGILATVIAGLIIGNYGAYKISPGIKEIMIHFWDYSAFLANSLLFLMVGIIIYSTSDIITPLIVPMFMVIGLVVGARAVMVYMLLPLMNFAVPRERIPLSWIHVIQWSGLRGALAIALVLTLPDTFPLYNELLIFTIGVISFTIILNGFTMRPLLRLFGLQSFSPIDQFRHEENQVLINQKVRDKLGLMRKKGFISETIHEELVDVYKEYRTAFNLHIKELFKNNRSELKHDQLALVLKQHLLGVEKSTFTKLYYHGEITQELLNVLLNNVHEQMDKLHLKGKVKLEKLTPLKPNGKIVKFLDLVGFENLKKNLKHKETVLRYEMYRARLIGTEDALLVLKDIRKTNVYLDKTVLTEYEAKYKKWRKNAQRKLKAIQKKYPTICHEIQLYLAKQAALHVEEKTIKDLSVTGMTTPRVYAQLKADLEERQRDLIV
jgi:monovalent cation:H+ antiporter, CPA1 family